MTDNGDPRAVFDAIRSKKDGPIKKFELIKAFGLALRQKGFDPQHMSCAELERRIEAIIQR